jgi:hypothetical protein
MAGLTPSVLAKLRAPFPAEQVRKNQDGMHYVSIDGYINRLLDVLGPDYNFVVTASNVELLENGPKTSSGKFQYLARVTGELSIGYTVRSGVGADVSFDADKAIKTAQAEALKKACHQYGIALELWDEETRKAIDRAQKLGKATPAQLKQEVWKVAKSQIDKANPTAKDVAAHFGVEPAALAEEDTLRKILESEGLL